MNYHFFWGGPFSNWYQASFTYNDIEFSNTEQFMMYYKAKFFLDDEKAKEILKTRDARKIKRLGREVANFKKEAWEAVARQIVYIGNLQKYTQNENLKQLLLDTDDAVLVEASPYDTIWGIGLSEEDPLRVDPNNWKGSNWLGQILTEIKKDLKQNDHFIKSKNWDTLPWR